jgi:hypothetical protein
MRNASAPRPSAGSPPFQPTGGIPAQPVPGSLPPRRHPAQASTRGTSNPVSGGTTWQGGATRRMCRTSIPSGLRCRWGSGFGRIWGRRGGVRFGPKAARRQLWLERIEVAHERCSERNCGFIVRPPFAHAAMLVVLKHACGARHGAGGQADSRSLKRSARRSKRARGPTVAFPAVATGTGLRNRLLNSAEPPSKSPPPPPP